MSELEGDVEMEREEDSFMLEYEANSNSEESDKNIAKNATAKKLCFIHEVEGDPIVKKLKKLTAEVFSRCVKTTELRKTDLRKLKEQLMFHQLNYLKI